VIKINLIREARPSARTDAAAARPVAGAAAAPASARDLGSLLLVIMLIAGLVGSGGYWFMKNRALKRKQAEVEASRAEAQKLEAIIAEVEQFQKRKDSLEKRIALINQLKQSQKGPVRVMDKISLLLPDLVWLTQMSVDGTRVSLTGKALHPNSVANYIENIKKDSMFDEPTIDALNQGLEGTSVVYTWGLSFNFKYLPEDAAAAAGAAPGAQPVTPAAPTAGG
jgi:Tfp pilus assembly protein PilN